MLAATRLAMLLLSVPVMMVESTANISGCDVRVPFMVSNDAVDNAVGVPIIIAVVGGGITEGGEFVSPRFLLLTSTLASSNSSYPSSLRPKVAITFS
ncbi:hypothetical protein BC829DRAFT_379397 [Chytridium lagenaria]|nr:hypothetical protein BC829DRAFT_379397 [Chytridium lagenaria]